jgi:Tol biopolymer transport system component
MRDLDDRFRSLSHTPAPDLWHDVIERDPARSVAAPGGRRVVAIVVALAISVTGLASAVWVFRGVEPRRLIAASATGRIAFAAPDGGTSQIYSVEPDGTDVVQVTHVHDPLAASDPAWSPDGSEIAYVVKASDTDRSEIWVSSADGTNPHPVVQEVGAREPSWSPDGARIAFTNRDGQIWITRSDGMEKHAFTLCGPPECVADSSPVWSPDGSHIAFIRKSGAGALVPFSIFVWPMKPDDGGADDIALDGATWASDLAWSPDGSEFALVRLTDEGSSPGIFVIASDGSTARGLAAPAGARAPAWSPDGRLIAVSAPGDAGGADALYVIDADGSGVREIPDLPSNASDPSWQPVLAAGVSPSSTPPAAKNGSIFFRVGGGDGGSWIDAIEPDGSGRKTVFDGEPTRIAQIAVFSSSRYDPSSGLCQPGADFACPTDIYVIDADGSDVSRLTDDAAPEYQPARSPDGRRIAFVRVVREPSGTLEAARIFAMSATGARIVAVSSGDGGATSSRVGLRRRSHRVRRRRRPMVMRPDGTGVRVLATAPGYGVAGDISWRPTEPHESSSKILRSIARNAFHLGQPRYELVSETTPTCVSGRKNIRVLTPKSPPVWPMRK